MRYYFPDAAVVGERIVGLTKSIVAIRRARPAAEPPRAH
jgi:hypothetical protein